MCTAHTGTSPETTSAGPPPQPAATAPLPPSATDPQCSSPAPPMHLHHPPLTQHTLFVYLFLSKISNKNHREGYKCLDFSYPTAKNKMKVTIKAQKDTPHPIKVKVCSVSSSLMVLCSNHETTEDTKPPQINPRLLAGLAPTPQSGRERLLAHLHLIHLQQDSKIRGVVAKTGSGVQERCHHRTASCGPHPTSIWADMRQKNR